MTGISAKPRSVGHLPSLSYSGFVIAPFVEHVVEIQPRSPLIFFGKLSGISTKNQRDSPATSPVFLRLWSISSYGGENTAMLRNAIAENCGMPVSGFEQD